MENSLTVIVVDQLLTGFDAPELNTLYVDRTLKGAGLIQAYSKDESYCRYAGEAMGTCGQLSVACTK